MPVTVTTTDKCDVYTQLKQDMAALNASYVKAGFPENQPIGKQERQRVKIKGVGSYSKIKGSAHDAYKDMSEVARIAVWNEFGVPEKNIPARPFFRNALDGSRSTIGEFQEKIAGQVMDGRMKPKAAFENLGLWMKSKIQKAIRVMHDPANAERTIKAKGSSHPLIDTGQLINSVTHVTVPGKAGSMSIEVL